MGTYSALGTTAIRCGVLGGAKRFGTHRGRRGATAYRGGRPPTACYYYYVPPCLSVCLSVAYIGNNSRTERPRKTKIGTQVAHVTRDSDTTFKVKRSGQLARAWEYCGGLAYIVNIHQLVNIHGAHSYWKQGALGAAGVRRVGYGLEVGRSVRRIAGGAGGHIVSPRAQLVIKPILRC